MTHSFVQCPGCGVICAGPIKECTACGTLLPSHPIEPVAAPPAQYRAASEPGKNADESGWRRMRGVAHVFLAFLLVLMAGIAAIKLGAEDLYVDLALTALFAVLACLALAFGWKTLVPALRSTGGVFGLLAALVGLGAIVGFAAVYFPLLRELGIPLIRSTENLTTAGFPIWSIYALISLSPAICEELLFRGYITARLSDLLSPTETTVVQAVLFALIHLSPAIFPSHFFMGLVLGLVRRGTGSIYPGMLVHAAWNAGCVYSEIGW